MLNVFYYYHILSYSLGSIFYQYTRGAQKVMSHVFFSRILFAQNVCNSRTVQLDVSFTHDIFPYSLHLRLRPYASAKQGHACLYQLGSCSRSHVLTAWITLSSSSNLVPRSASFSGPKKMKIWRRQIRTMGGGDGGAHSNQIWRLPPGLVDLCEGGHCRAESVWILDSC